MPSTNDYLYGFHYLETATLVKIATLDELTGEHETEFATGREAFTIKSKAVITPPGGAQAMLFEICSSLRRILRFHRKQVYLPIQEPYTKRAGSCTQNQDEGINVFDRYANRPFGMNHLDNGSGFGQSSYYNLMLHNFPRHLKELLSQEQNPL
ncbi:hypothetical protein [Chryseobacterium koreense]|uniref:hypothetical protein n=1 Tax=Chryseobacterium koreense TaxID=232216 RepID=UPI0026F1788D|nr:hypothetical protein [Chryseobacterium koreense]